MVEYSDGLVLILENKPSRDNVWAGQLSPSRASFEGISEDVDLYENAVSLEWADVLECLLAYSGSEVAPYAERNVVSDFLTFAETVHPALSPYRTFELCGTRPEALSKRIERLLNDMADRAGYEVRKRPGGAPYVHLPNEAVRQIHLTIHETRDADEPALRLSLWPGDTVHQARSFLRSVDRPKFFSLHESGWTVTPNLHFSHMQKHLVWASTSIPVSEYLEYFASNPREVGQSRFEDHPLNELSTRWLDLGLISKSDIADLSHRFGETRRSFINVIPGFQLRRDWPMPAIRELEAQGRLEEELWGALAPPFSAWGDHLSAVVST